VSLNVRYTLPPPPVFLFDLDGTLIDSKVHISHMTTYG